MNDLDFTVPTSAEMARIEEQARMMRAHFVRSFFVKLFSRRPAEDAAAVETQPAHG